MIIADMHTHTSFSGDSTEPIENIIDSAIEKGLKYLCITEHMDMDFPEHEGDEPDVFLLDTDSYMKKFMTLKEKYAKSNPDFTLLFGVELGLQPHLANTHEEYVSKYPFDFVIGSQHIVNRTDPYYPEYFNGRSDEDAFLEYFEDILTNLNCFKNFNTFGHLDYVVRYSPNQNKYFSYEKFSSEIDKILIFLIENKIALEVNSAGYKSGLGEPNPCKDILVRYKQLGGHLITIGSDAHDQNRVAADFNKIGDLLRECGYDSYYYYKNRRPHKLDL